MYPEDLKTITDLNVRHRIAIERKIVRAVVKAALAAGFTFSVDDGEEVIPAETEQAAMNALLNTDEDYLFLRQGNKTFGWVRFVYGNDGWDVISDYSTNLDFLMGEGTEVDKIVEAES